MVACLIAYDAEGNVIATLDSLVTVTENGPAIVDFDAMADGPLRTRADGSAGVWDVQGAAGSSTWPEWLGSRALDFRVETEGEGWSKRAVALVHKRSHLRRERAEIERSIRQRIDAAEGGVADIRDIVGGPDRPLRLGDDGRALAPPRPARVLPTLKAHGATRPSNGSR